MSNAADDFRAAIRDELATAYAPLPATLFGKPVIYTGTPEELQQHDAIKRTAYEIFGMKPGEGE